MTDFKTLNNLVPEIVTHENLSESFDYVVRDLKPEQKERIKKKKDAIIDYLHDHITDGSFQITGFKNLHVKDGPKGKGRASTSSCGQNRLPCNYERL